MVPELAAKLDDLKNGRNLTTLTGDSLLVRCSRCSGMGSAGDSRAGSAGRRRWQQRARRRAGLAIAGSPPQRRPPHRCHPTLTPTHRQVSKAKDVLRLATSSGQKIPVDEAAADLKAGASAILHVIDGVLLPKASPGAKPSEECTHVVQSGEILVRPGQRSG